MDILFDYASLLYSFFHNSSLLYDPIICNAHAASGALLVGTIMCALLHSTCVPIFMLFVCEPCICACLGLAIYLRNIPLHK